MKLTPLEKRQVVGYLKARSLMVDSQVKADAEAFHRVFKLIPNRELYSNSFSGCADFLENELKALADKIEEHA
jgi:hypothetical protein